MPQPFGPDSLWWDYLESDPVGRRANYFSYEDQFANTPNKKKWFQQQFQNVQDKYQGTVGKTVLDGGDPSLTATKYLKDYWTGGQAQQDYSSLSPSARGVDDNRFAPIGSWRF